MSNIAQQALLVLVALAVINETGAQAPLFLQAITSALGTIPFSAGPMTTGLLGAKLAFGSKLLYYLGLFGGRRSKPKSPRKPPLRAKPTGGAQFPGGMQVPLPYAFAGNGFPSQAGHFSAGGFGNSNPFSQFPMGYDPAQMFQMFAAQGIDPATAMQAMNNFDAGHGGQASQFSGGQAAQFPGSQAIPSSQFPIPTDQGLQSGGSSSSASGKPPSNQDSSGTGGSKDDESDNDVESFFTFLRDMDDNTCISRLICDIGADPAFLGEFSENIHGIISSLDVKPSSGAFQYIAIMKTGKSEGGCAPRYPQCGDMAYAVVKNVAPSVGVPTNINSEMVNNL